MDTNRRSFDLLYSRLEPVLIELEQYRKDLKAEGSKNGLIGGCIVLIAGLFFIGQIKELYIFFVFLAIGIGLFCINSKSSEVSYFYKNNIIRKMVSVLCHNAEYKPERGISESLFSGSGLFSAPDRYSSEDMISGKIDKTDFMCSEALAEERHVSYDSKGRRREYWSTLFKGFLFIADFHKNFSGRTIVVNDSLFKFGFGMKRVKLENPEFESRFDIYSTDGIEARYILTPSMMERLIVLDKKFHQKIQLSYVGSSVFIAIPDSKNHFEASIWHPLTKDDVMAEFSIMCALLDIVNDMNLNTRIWTKE